jgi:UDP-3-O-[3-hydroxymyristoyl] N-acetylglucosamine deacetylase
LRLKKARIIRADHATTIAGSHFSVSTVEHLLAALRILGADNVIVELDGPEIPIMDGSAAPFIYLLREAGLRRQMASRGYLMLKRRVDFKENGREISIEPADRLRVTYTIDFPGTFIGRQTLSRTLHQKLFIDEIAPARTFCFLKDVEALRERGLARGGTLDNAVVVDENGPMSRLRFPDEFVRHKILDLVGDLALLGMPILGHVIAQRGGHALHARLLESLRQDGVTEVVHKVGSGEPAMAEEVAAAVS